MDISGQWYMNPGDVPADFVVPVVLHAGGQAEWPEARFERFREAGGKLIIGDLDETHYIFDTSRPGSDFLTGVIKTPIAIGEDEDPAEVGGFFSDCAMLLRSPGELRILDRA